MKLATYSTATTEPRAAIVDGTQVFDIASASGGALPSVLLEVMARPHWKRELDDLIAANPAPSHDLADVSLHAPIERPGKLLAAAGNYQAHVDEGGGDRVDTTRRTPRIFLKPSSSIIAAGAALSLPTVSHEVDWEIELAIVIGRTARNVSVTDALDVVGGYAVINDVSARSMSWGIEDREVHEWDRFFDWLTGKWIDGFAPLGPWIVTADDIADPDALDLSLQVNGEIWQQATTADMIFSCAELVAFCSRICTLEPGDIIATGTPAGCGVASGRFLTDGDVMVGTVAGLGELRTPVVGP